MATYLTAMLIGLVLWSIVCRVNAMSKLTMDRVFLQHLALAVGVFTALFVPMEWAVVSVLAGMAFFLGVDAARWRHGAPPETTKPTPLNGSRS